jgi:hypothetical protein
VPEPGRPDPLLVSRQFVPPAATAAQLGRLAHGGRLGATFEAGKMQGKRVVTRSISALTVNHPDHLDSCELVAYV